MPFATRGHGVRSILRVMAVSALFLALFSTVACLATVDGEPPVPEPLTARGSAGSSDHANRAATPSDRGAPPASAPSTGRSRTFLDGFFPIAVDGPRPDDFAGSTDCSPSPATGAYAGWSSCGVNTIARGPDCSDESCPPAFDALVTAAGLRMIRAPLPDPAHDIAKHAGDHLLLAWAQMDEPDARGGLSRNLPTLTSNYASLTALVGHPPIYLNVGGSDLLVTQQDYQTAFAQADWVANDIYPVSGFLDESLPRDDLSLVGRALDKLAEVAPDKPRFAWIETNDILGKGDPTPAQVRAEIWIAIVHGARGILYFQEQVQPAFDLLSTSAAVRAEMGKQHATITQLSAVLQGPINPPTLAASVAAPLTVGWRQAASARYIIVVNTSGSTLLGASLTLTGLPGAQAATVWDESRMVQISTGRLVDDFAPYARHIYVVP